jgi:hypothetical protein
MQPAVTAEIGSFGYAPAESVPAEECTRGRDNNIITFLNCLHILWFHKTNVVMTRADKQDSAGIRTKQWIAVIVWTYDVDQHAGIADNRFRIFYSIRMNQIEFQINVYLFSNFWNNSFSFWVYEGGTKNHTFGLPSRMMSTLERCAVSWCHGEVLNRAALISHVTKKMANASQMN